MGRPVGGIAESVWRAAWLDDGSCYDAKPSSSAQGPTHDFNFGAPNPQDPPCQLPAFPYPMPRPLPVIPRSPPLTRSLPAPGPHPAC